MLKFTYHSLRRAQERGLNLNVIANQVINSCDIGPRKIRIFAGDMTVVVKREGKELVVITAWKTPAYIKELENGTL